MQGQRPGRESMCAIKYEFTFLYEWNTFSDLEEGLE